METISCIVAVDMDDFCDKAMIGLIEKNGNLRVYFEKKKIYLFPIEPVKMKEGDWQGIFRNDSMEIQISGPLKHKDI